MKAYIIALTITLTACSVYAKEYHVSKAGFDGNSGTTGVIAKAFETARKANPRAVMILNDFNTSKKYEKTIEDCLAGGVEIDVVGIQSHREREKMNSRFVILV